MNYLGTVLSFDGLPGHELSRRIGIAKGDFMALEKIWKHSSLNIPQKIHIYKALVESKLLYSLCCQCLSAVERRRLDGFQARCLRKIFGVPPAFISRVSNMTILQRAKCKTATDLLLQRQILLFGKVARAPINHPLHMAAFIPGTWQPITDKYVRRVGRPRREWVTEVRTKIYQCIGGHLEVSRLVRSPLIWRYTVCQRLSVHAPRGVWLWMNEWIIIVASFFSYYLSDEIGLFKLPSWSCFF